MTMTDAIASEEPALPAGVTIHPLSPGIGIEVRGVDLSEPFGDDVADCLRTLYERYHVLMFRQPDLPEEGQTRLANLVGRTSQRERNRTKIASKDNQYVSNVRPDGIFGKGELTLHMDQLFLEEPLKALILYAVEIPETGGDTIFADSMAAYDSMPDALKARINGLNCRHTRVYDAALSKDWNVVDGADHAPSTLHPMARTDPRSGRKALWANELTTVGVDGLDAEDSAALLKEARGYLDNPAITYHHRWTPGDLILWDNSVVKHARTPFDPEARRTLRRTAIL